MKTVVKRSKYKFRGKRQPKGAVGRAISCDGKVRWWSREVARSHAEEINQRLIGDRPVRDYRCAYSPKENPHWHVGRSPKK